MTFFLTTTYKWCDLSGGWHTGYPSDLNSCLKINYCEPLSSSWKDCTPPACSANTPTTPAGQSVLDGIVQGTAGDDVIDQTYTGDPQGDRIDANDQILSGEGVNDDIVLGGAGNDIIKSGNGNDEVYAGSGNDYVDGGAGNDLIYGDKGGDAPTVTIQRESFEWAKAPDPSGNGTSIDNGDDLTRGFSQNTGSVNVTFSQTKEYYAETEFSTDAQNVKGVVADGAAVNANSSLESGLDHKGEYANYELDFSAPVSNVSFNINDIDGDGVVKVMAYDAQGNLIDVDMTGGSGVTLIDSDGKFGVDTADSKGGYAADTSQAYSVNVSIPGPVSKIVVMHSQNGYNDSGVNVTDVYFDAGAAIPEDTGVAGDDTLLGGSGDDTIYGEAGNDTIYGNQNGGGSSQPVTYVREGLEWDKAPDPSGNGTSIDDGDNLNGGFTQKTGNVDVKFSVVDANENPATTFETEAEKVHSITADGEAVNANSSLDSVLDKDGETATYRLEFSSDVKNVSFRINDIDYASTVEVRAYGLNGNLVPINIGTGSGITATNADGVAGNEMLISRGGGGLETNPDYSALVNVAGPISRIDIVHTKVQALSPGADAGINITDVYFDAPVAGTGDGGSDGNDMLFGGAGDDLIFGEGGNDAIEGGAGNDIAYGGTGNDTIAGDDGNDTLYGDAGDDNIAGGSGADKMYGGDGRDTFIGGAGDTVDGGAGGDDYDTLVLPDGSYYLNTGPDGTGDPIADADGNSFTGRIVFTDENGVPTGEVINYTEIEALRGGTVANIDPDAQDDAFTATSTEASGDSDGNVLTNDNDANGDTLTVVGVGAVDAGVDTPVAGDNGGLFTIKANGDVDFNANGEFDDLGLNDVRETSVTYTISDGKGGFDTATVTFEVGGTNDGTVFGTDGNDVMNPGYVDANGDIIDGNDAILLDDVGNDDLIYGLGGNDTINAGNGDDEVYGGEGNDSIAGSAGKDTVYGDAGNDIVRGGDGADTVYGGEGDDTGFGGDGDDTVFGDAGNDTLNGNAGNDLVYGGTGNDSINGESGDDTLYGDAGNDNIAGGRGSDTVFGGEGDDVIDTGNGIDARFDNPYPGIPGPAGEADSNPFDDRDVVYGGAGNDTITTGDDQDTIFGGEGDDKIDAGSDNDFISGGIGNDIIIGGEGVDAIYGDDGDDLIYGGLEVDTLDIVDFDDAGNAIDKLPGNNKDTIYGGNGNDTIYGRDDADSIFGGNGDDLVYGGIDDDTIFGGSGNDTLYGDQGNDTIAGNMGDDTIYGGDGDDSLTGSMGNDSVYGGAGNDFIQGGADTDLLDGGDGDDTLQGANGDDLIYGGAGNDRIQGGGGDDTIDGGDGDDSINGSFGNDFIEGGAGNDIIGGDGGADVIYGGSGNDIINTDQGAAALPDQDYPGDGLVADPDPFDNRDTVYGGEGDDTIKTGDDADLIYGGIGNDTIDGGVDNDTIYSGDGADVVKGGLGSDRFMDASSGDVIVGGEDPDVSDIDTFNFDQETMDKIDRIVRNGGAGASEADRESGTIYFKDGTTATFREIEAPCFTPGTTIATPRGERLVEDLRQGDKIITRDNGIQEIAWVGSKEMTGKELAAKPHMKPILIKAGALGHGLPERDMLLSPNHRVLVASEKTQLYFEEREVLAAAKHMTGGQGIHTLDVMRTTYIHFMFERHEVVLSNGAWTESFHPGDYSLNGLGNSQRNEIFELFPELQTDAGLEGYQSARKALKKHEARLLMK